MRPNRLRASISRRWLLWAGGTAAVTLGMGDAVLKYAPWLDYVGQAQRTWDTPFHNTSGFPEQMRELIRYATLAPSGHNARPDKNRKNLDRCRCCLIGRHRDFPKGGDTRIHRGRQ